MAGKINGANHLPLTPPIMPPPERPITNPANQGNQPVKVKGKSKAGGSGSQKVGTNDAQHIDGGLQQQLPDAVQQKPQQRGFSRQDSFRSDEVQKGALQQQTIGQGPRQKQSQFKRELTTARKQHGFAQSFSNVSNSQIKGEARDVQRNQHSPINQLQQRTPPVQSFAQNSEETVRGANPMNGVYAASEVTQQVTAPTIDALSSLLQDQSVDPTSQMNAANSLGQLKQPEASPALLEAAYGDQRWEVRDAAMQALAQFPEQAAHYVQQHFDHLSPQAQSAALDHLSRQPNESAVQTFLAATDSPLPELRHKGLKKLESALMFERSSGQPVFGHGDALRQQVVNTAARLSRDNNPTVSAQAADLLYHL